MPEVTLDDVPRRTRDAFNKAQAALDRGNYDYAIDMLGGMLDAEPRFLSARRLLRVAQVRRYRERKPKAGPLDHVLSLVAGLPTYVRAQMALRKDPMQAMGLVEKLMSLDPLNQSFGTLLAQTAEAADMPQAGIQAIEILRESAPDNVDLISWLARLHGRAGDTGKSRELYEHVLAMRPNDPKAIKAVKDAQALDTITSQRMEEARSTRDLIKDAGEARVLDAQSKAVKTDSDVDLLIEEHRQKIEAEPGNINYRRGLAELYLRKSLFDEAVATMEECNRITGGGDPQVDRLLSTIKVRRFNAEIESLRAGGKTAEADAREKTRDEFIFSDTEDRVRRYPNDLQFRYEYGVLLFERGQFTEAIQQFQLSQRNLQRRIRSLYYLALCFERKEQCDIASEQLLKAVAELSIMDGTKKDVLYELGAVYEKLGQTDKAIQCFKDIYTADIAYRDVAHKVEKQYAGR